MIIIALVLLLVITGVVLLFRKKKAVSCVLFALGAILLIAIPFFYMGESQEHSINPEWLYTGQSEVSGGRGNYEVIYHIKWGPFPLESYFQPENINRYQTVMTEQDRNLVIEFTQDSNYTYILSYGCTVEKVDYKTEPGFDWFSLVPFAPRVSAPQLTYGNSTPYLFHLYRIPAAVIDNID